MEDPPLAILQSIHKCVASLHRGLWVVEGESVGARIYGSIATQTDLTVGDAATGVAGQEGVEVISDGLGCLAQLTRESRQQQGMVAIELGDLGRIAGG